MSRARTGVTDRPGPRPPQEGPRPTWRGVDLRDTGDSTGRQLDLLLLSVLRAGPAHGYAVIEELKRRSDGLFDLTESTVYPALHRIEGRALLASTWAEVNGRRRRTYHLTDKGRRALGE
ncbi:MAG: PadR family transcriptional regulator [Acidimicrobiales bacterium]